MFKKRFALLITIIIAFVIGAGIIAHQSSNSINRSFKCGDSVTFAYKGSVVTYGIVESQGECWMDRNLGASQVAIAFNDSDAYGDLFQWGRLDDGHQDRNSGTTSTLSITDNPGHSNFIYNDFIDDNTINYSGDWRNPQNDNLWQGVSGTNNPCPEGWRVPTDAEWDTELASWSFQNYNGAFDSSLKLTMAGNRPWSDASIYEVGSDGDYWSSSAGGTDGKIASYLTFCSSNATMYIAPRSNGFSVRCIKD